MFHRRAGAIDPLVRILKRDEVIVLELGNGHS